jgi:hypothetical protein
MLDKFNFFLDSTADFIAHRKGLIPLLAILLIILNFGLKFLPGTGWLVESDFFLHFGVITAIMGFLLAWAL